MTTLTTKKLVLASVGFLTLSTAAALAADVPQSRHLPPPRAPVYVPFFTWNGFYLGINGGYGFGQSSFSDPVAGVGTGDFDVSGPLIGGTLGYNMHFGSTVFGIEADLGWADIAGSSTTNCPAGCETRNTWLGTARGRIGYAFNRFMPYFTGGAAFGNLEATAVGLPSFSKTQVGWTVGGGLEYSFWSNWTMKLEYLYVDLGTLECPAASCGVVTDVTFTTNIFRAGLNYKF